MSIKIVSKYQKKGDIIMLFFKNKIKEIADNIKNEVKKVSEERERKAEKHRVKQEMELEEHKKEKEHKEKNLNRNLQKDSYILNSFSKSILKDSRASVYNLKIAYDRYNNPKEFRDSSILNNLAEGKRKDAEEERQIEYQRKLDRIVMNANMALYEECFNSVYEGCSAYDVLEESAINSRLYELGHTDYTNTYSGHAYDSELGSYGTKETRLLDHTIRGY